MVGHQIDELISGKIQPVLLTVSMTFIFSASLADVAGGLEKLHGLGIVALLIITRGLVQPMPVSA